MHAPALIVGLRGCKSQMKVGLPCASAVLSKYDTALCNLLAGDTNKNIADR